jgi:hypothetical protein
LTDTLKPETSMITKETEYDRRHCTDVICVIIGLLFSAIMFTLSFTMINQPNIARTAYPSDSTGKVCGYDYPNHPYIYFTNPPDVTQRVCVQGCPKNGDTALNCMATPDIGCKFSSDPDFTVLYYDNKMEAGSDNGNYCMPTDEESRQLLMTNGKLDSRNLFFKSFRVLELTVLFALAGSLLLFFVIQFLHRQGMRVVIILALLVNLALSVVLFLYETDKTTIKLILGVTLALMFVLTLVNLRFHWHSLDISKVFMHHTSIFMMDSFSTLFYIFFFLGILAGFFYFLILPEYAAFVSVIEPTFDVKNVYQEVHFSGFVFTMCILVIQMIWGFSFIKEAFSFCIARHTVLWFL